MQHGATSRPPIRARKYMIPDEVLKNCTIRIPTEARFLCLRYFESEAHSQWLKYRNLCLLLDNMLSYPVALEKLL